MVKLTVGLMGSSPSSGAPFLASASALNSFLDIVAAHNVRELDTARVYGSGQSERMMGEVKASERFTISTKAPGFSPGTLEASKIVANCKASLEALRQDKVDIYYIHGPDRQTPLEEQCRAFNELHQQGKFERFGVSNLSDAEVQQIYDICSSNGWVKPTVYQGGYNILSRGNEATLLPLLKKLGIAFYGYGPLAFGLLVKDLDQILNPEQGTHFADIPFLKNMYLQEVYLSALKEFKATCQEAGLTSMEVALRWTMNHSPLGNEDAILVGAGKNEHLDSTLTAAQKGPLPKELVDAVEALREKIKGTAPPYHL